MNLPKSRTTMLLRNALRDIRTCRAEPLHDEDIIWLWQLATAVTGPAGRTIPFTRAPICVPYLTPSPGTPHQAPGTTHHAPRTPHHAPGTTHLILYRLTLQAIAWISEIDTWWPGDDLLPAAYACAHSHGQHVPLFEIRDPTTIVNTVSTWSDTLTCNLDDLRHATRLQTGFPELNIDTRPPDPKQHPIDSATDATQWGPTLALLAGAYGIPPWELALRPYVDIGELLAQLSAVAAIHGALSSKDHYAPALEAFQEAVRFLKTGRTTVESA